MTSPQWKWREKSKEKSTKVFSTQNQFKLEFSKRFFKLQTCLEPFFFQVRHLTCSPPGYDEFISIFWQFSTSDYCLTSPSPPSLRHNWLSIHWKPLNNKLLSLQKARTLRILIDLINLFSAFFLFLRLNRSIETYFEGKERKLEIYMKENSFIKQYIFIRSLRFTVPCVSCSWRGEGGREGVVENYWRTAKWLRA